MFQVGKCPMNETADRRFKPLDERTFSIHKETRGDSNAADGGGRGAPSPGEAPLLQLRPKSFRNKFWESNLGGRPPVMAPEPGHHPVDISQPGNSRFVGTVIKGGDQLRVLAGGGPVALEDRQHRVLRRQPVLDGNLDRKSTRLNSSH